MTNKRLERRIKDDLTQKSQPNLDRITAKSSTISKDKDIIYDEVLTLARKRRVYMVLIGTFMVVLMVILGTVGQSKISKDIGTPPYETGGTGGDDIYFGHDTMVKWDFTDTIDSINERKGTKYKQFHGYTVCTSANALNYIGYVWVEYETFTESSIMMITLRIFSQKNVSLDYVYMAKRLGNEFIYGDFNVKYSYEYDGILHTYNVYMVDTTTDYTYILQIDDTEQYPLEHYLENLY